MIHSLRKYFLFFLYVILFEITKWNLKCENLVESIENVEENMPGSVMLPDSNQTSHSSSSIQKAFIIGFYSLVWVCGSIGGILVIFAIAFNTKLKSITNVHLLNLAIADFIFLQGIPFQISSLINRQWVFSAFVCKLFWSFTGVNQFTAIFLLTLLAFDRFILFIKISLSFSF